MECQGSRAQKIGRVKTPPPTRPVNGNPKSKGGPYNYNYGFQGVRQRRWGTWVAEIKVPGKRNKKWLGSFRSAEEAAYAYDRAALALYGAGAELNFYPFSAPPAISSHRTTLRRLLPRPSKSAPVRGYPGQPNPSAPSPFRFNDVPYHADPDPDRVVLVPVASMLMQETSDQNLHSFSAHPAIPSHLPFPTRPPQVLNPGQPHPSAAFQFSDVRAALQFSDVPDRAVLVPATSVNQTSDQNLHPPPPQSTFNCEKTLHAAPTLQPPNISLATNAKMSFEEIVDSVFFFSE